MAELTEEAIAQLRRDVDGYRGRFVFIVEHACSACRDEGGRGDEVVFVHEDESGDSCGFWYTISVGVEQHVGEPLARMLNAVGPLLGMLGKR